MHRSPGKTSPRKFSLSEIGFSTSDHPLLFETPGSETPEETPSSPTVDRIHCESPDDRCVLSSQRDA